MTTANGTITSQISSKLSTPTPMVWPLHQFEQSKGKRSERLTGTETACVLMAKNFS
jgi:hypothetical protein